MVHQVVKEYMYFTGGIGFISLSFGFIEWKGWNRQQVELFCRCFAAGASIGFGFASLAQLMPRSPPRLTNL